MASPYDSMTEAQLAAAIKALQPTSDETALAALPKPALIAMLTSMTTGSAPTTTPASATTTPRATRPRTRTTTQTTPTNQVFCSVCGKMFANYDELDAHRRDEHGHALQTKDSPSFGETLRNPIRAIRKKQQES